MWPPVSGPAWRQTWRVRSMVSSLPLLVRALGQVDVLEHEGFLVERGRAALAAELPGAHVGEVVVVAEGLALVGLALFAEVAAAALLAVEGVTDHQLAELEE